MDFARYFIKNMTTSWMVTLILLIGGTVSFLEIGRLEDPQFTIKQAMIITPYPGASPSQVEEEVTYPLENAIQELPYVKNIKSFSSAGLSQILVEMKSIYRKDDLQKIWTELRQKVSDKQSSLAAGASTSVVKDDFADVFGVVLAVSGQGYQYDDVRDYVNYLKRELVLIEGVGKVMVQGEQQEQIIVEISRTKISNLGISPEHLSALLATQNQVSNAGKVKIGSQYIRFNPTGEFQSVDELKDLVISSPGSNKLIHLGDVATIYRDYAEIPTNLIRFNGQQAMLLGISFADGVNVVDVGQRIEARMQELEYMRPVGMETNFVYNQAQEVDKSVQGFLINLIEAVAIVVIVLLVFMGLRSGLLIGLILLITVLGTFIFMQQMDITLQRISLGALIIALGMLVDNAIVVTEGILIGLQRKLTTAQAASAVVEQNKWPLLGATVIAIVAFAPIGLSSDATGEFAGSLFWVLLISLLLSWLTAITLTPFFASLMFTEKAEEDEEDELYQGLIFKAFGALLTLALAWRKTTIVALVALFIGSIISFGQVKQSFFPPSTTPMFFVDVWHKSGTDIRENAKVMEEIEAHLSQETGVEDITTTVGQGLMRFLLTYQTEKQYATYAQLAIRMEDLDALQATLPRLRQYMETQHGELFFKIKLMEIGPSTDAKIEARFSGPDPDVLRDLAEQAKVVLRADSGVHNIRDDWRQKTAVIRPQFNEASARRVGISKADLDDLLLTSFSGKTIGVYRDGVNLLPIVTQPPADEHLSVENLKNLQIYSTVAGQFIPITQVVSSFDIAWEDPIIARRDRKRTITVMADHDILGDETAANLFMRIKAPMENISLPKGYHLEWGGEYESSSDAQKALFGSLPLGYLVMFIITVLLFNSARIASVIWACIPLALIGVSYGLLFSGYAFSFMALLGMLSLSGMIIKNGIVLVEQIKFELEQGQEAYQALFHATLSRVRPVCMAAITTILGMIPLLFDAFFGSMAVAIMCGLGFSTFITLIFVPVLYSLVFKIKLNAS